MTKNTVKRMLDAIREAQSDNYVMTPQEAEALFGENEPQRSGPFGPLANIVPKKIQFFFTQPVDTVDKECRIQKPKR